MEDTKKMSETPQETTTEIVGVSIDPDSDKEPKEKKEMFDKPLDYKMRFIKRGRKKFAGEFGEDGEELDDDRFSNLMNRLADFDEERDERYDKLVDGNRKLYEIFEKDPDTFAVFELLRDGTPLPIALRKVYKDEDYLTMDETSDAYKKYKKEKDDERKRNDKFAKNSEDFKNAREEYYKEAGMSEDDIKQFEDAESAFYEGMAEGRFDKDYFKRITKALNYDKDIEDSYKQGEVDGKNSRIKEYVKQTVGDGLPDNDGFGGGAPTRKEQLDPRVDMFRRIADKSNETKWKY